MTITFTFETQRRRRGHNFLPPVAVRRKVPALYATEPVPFDDKVVYVKWFVGGSTWYLAEADWETGLCFGYVEGTHPEWGYFHLHTLETAEVASWLVVERDCYFEPTRFGDLPA